ncbi:protein kinase domain-containing protein [Streptomyces peucetius]|uniref:Serine/threonine-protein kinase n=1 Tax=Streptomyces peucetius TaxID=1950 RepID=A0ABY6IFZ1_STRPE|nr:serine/threonine-protein kinase [Streptomyces peucetius]UYQ64757.1 serine/threonine-protein kinase [Streptomyces peucetius]
MTHDDPGEIGGFRLLARLGHGGMGTVYLARTAEGRTVALKTMHASIAADPAARTRFRLETDAARIIGDHHGAAVVDADPAAETPWLATEYVLGPPLDDAVELCGPLPETTVRALGAALFGALSQLHASEVVHRDLKPSNIMVTAYGPKIIDFGIARAAGDDRLTRTGTAAGTPAYMSPEQATGQEHTPAGDVFALAGVLVFAATGHGPFGGGQAADLLYRVRYADPDLSGVPTGIVPFLSRCLDKDPARRPRTDEAISQLHSGHGHFADHLPDALLADIARRATAVWQPHPQRLSPPSGHTTETSSSTGPRTYSRRGLLTIGGASLAGAAAVGAGIWAWANAGGAGDRADGKSKSPAPVAAKGDWLWELPLRLEGASLAPPVPLNFGPMLAIADDDGVRTIDINTGSVDNPSLLKGPAHRCTHDGDTARVYASEVVHAGNHPLTISSINFGRSPNPFTAELKEYNGALPATQLLSAYAEVVFVAAGQGEHSGTGIGYGDSQEWHLIAVDARTAKVLWRHLLPSRPAASDRLHFLAARAVKDHLVVLQEMSDGTVFLAVHDSRRGRELWRQELDVPEPEAIRGVLEANDWYVFPPSGPLRALALKDGKEAWSFGPGRAKARTGPPVIGSLELFAVEEGFGLIAIDWVTGELVRRAPDRNGADLDVTLPPAPGVGKVYSYSSKSGLLRSYSVKTGETVTARKARGDLFHGFHGIPAAIVAIGGDYLAAYPYD